MKIFHKDKILKKFEKFEISNHLDKKILFGVYWWDVLRAPIYENLILKLKKKNLYKSYESKNHNKLNNFYALFKKVYLYFFLFFRIFSFNSPIWIKRNSYIVFGHPRRLLENNIYLDKYTDPFLELFNSNKKFCVIEKPVNNILKFPNSLAHYKPAITKNLFYSESLFFLFYIFKIFLRFKISKKSLKEINFINKDFKKRFKLNINLLKKIFYLLPNFKSEYYVYRLLFKIKKPKKIFIVCSPGSEAIIAAAKSLNIQTYELQHGSPSRGKLNYDYSSGISKFSFPDYFLSFGSFWTRNVKLPISNKNIIPIGFPYLNKKKNLKKKKLNQLLIISQIGKSKELINFTLKIRKRLNEKIDILFKLHPSENSNEIQGLLNNLRKKKIKVIESKSSDMYKFLSESKWVLGVYSTSLYEALAFNCKIFVLKTSGYEFVKKLIEKNFFILVKSASEMTKKMPLNNRNRSKSINFLFNQEYKKKFNFLKI